MKKAVSKSKTVRATGAAGGRGEAAVGRAAAIVRDSPLDPAAAQEFVRLAKSNWKDNPEQWHQLEWRYRTKVMGAIVATGCDRATVAVVASLASLSRASSIKRWFA